MRTCSALLGLISSLDRAFFFRFIASNAFLDIGSVGRIERKNLKRKSQELSE